MNIIQGGNQLKMKCKCPRSQPGGAKTCGWYTGKSLWPTTLIEGLTCSEPATTEAPVVAINASNCVGDQCIPDFEPLTDKVDTGLTHCGASESSKIINGQEAVVSSWPWIVNVILSDDLDDFPENSHPHCGGTVLNSHWVLTAGHCCVGHSGNTYSSARMTFGDHDVTATQGNQFTVEGSLIIPHPDYENDLSDACLIKANENIFTRGQMAGCGESCVAAACLPDVAPIHGKGCWVAGWGTTTPGGGGDVNEKLLEVGVNLLSKEYCQGRF